MTGFVTQFFLCNLFLCIFIGILFSVKRIFGRYIPARAQYRLWFLLYPPLALPFLPGSAVPRFLSFLNPAKALLSRSPDFGSAPASAAQALLLPAPAVDFAVSVNRSLLGALPPSVCAFFLLIWLAGILVLSVSLLRQWRQFTLLERSALPVQHPAVRALISDCLAESGIPTPIPVYSSAFLRSPAAAGGFCPRIYLPIHLISGFQPQELRYMLLHELQHCRHKDALAGGLMNLAGIVYWFHPLVRRALKEMRCDREIACDSAVLELLPEEEYTEYGRTLLRFAETLSHRQTPFAAGIGGSHSQIKARILHIAAYRPLSFPQKLRGWTVCLALSALLLVCLPALSVFSAAFHTDTDVYAFPEAAHSVSRPDISSFFGTYTGSFVLYDDRSGQWIISDKKAATRRISPNSTYKIYDALLGLESGILTPEDSTMLWDGASCPFDEWEADQNLTSALQNSVNWYFQRIDRTVGRASVRRFLKKLSYGSQTIGTNLELYWTDGSLRISPVEQVELLRKFYENQLGFAAANTDAVKSALRISDGTDGTLSGKTGTGRIDGKDTNGWFIGYVETDGRTLYFATNIQSDKNADGAAAKDITLSILSGLSL